MKKIGLILLSLNCAVTLAQVPGPVHETGFSDQYRSENTLGEYTFGYNEDHTSGGSFRRETSDRLGNKFGSYGLRVGDGRVRIVNYVADQNGFRADVFSNEPGIESQNSNKFSRITKKNIYTVIVPGFKYSSAAPHVSFEGNQQDSSFHNAMVDETGMNFNVEDNNFEGEDFSNVHGSEGNQEDNLAGVFPNQPGIFDEAYSERQLDSSNFNVNEDQLFEDHFTDDQYIYESETVIQNRTLGTQFEQKARDMSFEAQKIGKDSLSNLQNDDSTRNQERSYENKQYLTSTTPYDDLYPYQSTIVMSESKEQVISQDVKNSTIDESSNSKNSTSTTVLN